jgi:UDP-GlcNAc3NAcA epimerase
MMEMLDEIVIKEKPDAVLLYGDTNSTLAGALVASKLHVPVGHVEAGLRSFNMRMPEEINRILTDRVSKWLFCPTPTAVKNLKNEGYDNIDAEIHMTGDVMYDAAIYYAGLLDKRPTRLNLKEKEFVLATIHREENTHHPDNLKRVTGILNWLNKQVPVVMPVHPGTAARFRQNAITPEFTMIDPAGYFDMIRLLQGCSFVVTDSGGLQKEASFFNKFCLTLREQTEWVELVENGVNFIGGTNEEKVKGYTEKIRGMKFPENLQLYGDGYAGEKITKILSDSL